MLTEYFKIYWAFLLCLDVGGFIDQVVLHLTSDHLALICGFSSDQGQHLENITSQSYEDAAVQRDVKPNNINIWCPTNIMLFI